MGKKPFSRYFVYKELRADDSSALQSFATKLSSESRSSWILGNSFQENRSLAQAYSKNKELYPYSYLIFEKHDAAHPIGCLIAQLSSSGDTLDTSIVLTGDMSHFKTVAILSEFYKFAQEEGFKVIFNSHDEKVMEILNNFGFSSNLGEVVAG